MTIQGLYINEASVLVPLEPTDISRFIREESVSVWVDLQYTESTQIEECLDLLNIKGLVRRLCLQGMDRAGYYPFKNDALMVLPVMIDADDPDVPTELDHLAIYFTDSLVFTIHQKPILDADLVSTLQESDDWIPEFTLAGLVSALLMNLSLSCLQFTAELRDSVFALEKRMDHDPDSVEVDEILDMRTELYPLATVVGGQLPSIKVLSTTERSFFGIKEERDYLNCALVNFETADISLGWLDQRIGALHLGFQMHTQDKTNRRLGLLTILSAIFMPLTLLAGIWGMNFENMPELNYPYAYPAALSLMALIGVGMFLFFRKGGWFD